MKRLNVMTGLPFKYGDVDQQRGKIFGGYTKKLRSDGYLREIWLDPEKADARKRKAELIRGFAGRENEAMWRQQLDYAQARWGISRAELHAMANSFGIG